MEKAIFVTDAFKDAVDLQDAVDIVCLNCTQDTLNELICENCPVRKTVDDLCQ